MRKALIETGPRKKKEIPLPSKEKEKNSEKNEEDDKDLKNQPIADLSYINNYRMLDVYDVYFKKDELNKNLEEDQEKLRRMAAIFVLKNYKLEIDEKDWDFLELEIYSHDDPYLNLMLLAFSEHEKGGPHPGCLVFWLILEREIVKGKYLICVSSIKRSESEKGKEEMNPPEKEIIYGRRSLYNFAQGKNYQVKSPSREVMDAYNFDPEEHVYTAPRIGLTFDGFQGEEELKFAAKHIMKARSYCRFPKFLSEQEKRIYAYQAMRNNEGKVIVAKDLEVKDLKLAAWLRQFYKIEEIRDPNRFLMPDFDWFNFEDYLKAFKYFTNV